MANPIPVDDFSPIFVGDVSNPLSLYVAHLNGFLNNLATVTMKLFNAATNTLKTCSGTWTIDPANNGKASYVFQSGDVDTAGTWQIWIIANGVHLDDGTGNPKVLVILPLPPGV